MGTNFYEPKAHVASSQIGILPIVQLWVVMGRSGHALQGRNITVSDVGDSLLPTARDYMLHVMTLN